MRDNAKFSRPASYSQSAAAASQNLSPGPYVGIVKQNADQQRMGRLWVWLPLLSPDEEDQTKWVCCSYASPFAGFTRPPNNDGTDNFTNTKHAYGMWFIPPDIGVKVLVVFADGQSDKAFWISCIFEGHSHYMVPGLGASINSDFKTGPSTTIPQDQRPDRVPVVEYNDNNPTLDGNPAWFKNPKPMHQTQERILQEQGLDFDYLRGAILTSSQRESPSQVFGISTPGRLIDDGKTEGYKVRRGGHTFVMDDGDSVGDNNFTRLRTAGGHQILMHDTGDFMYISNSKGTAWVEINSVGDIEIFSNGNFSLRAATNINLHADGDINMYAGNKLKVVAESGMDLQSNYINLNSVEDTTIHACKVLNLKSGAASNFDATGNFSIKSDGTLFLNGGPTIKLNSGGAKTVTPLNDIKRSGFPNALRNLDSYKSVAKRINSISTRVPTHEPDVGHAAKADQVRNAAAINMADDAIANLPPQAGRVPAPPVSVLTDSHGNAILSGTGVPVATPNVSDKTDAAPNITAPVPNTLANLPNAIDKQPDPSRAVGTLTKDETKAFMTTIGQAESGGNYNLIGGMGNIGKYQMSASTLVDQNFISKDLFQKYGGSNAVMDNPAAWTGVEAAATGITSKAAFLNAPGVQESVMQSVTETNYTALVSNGAIRATDSSEIAAGSLAVAHKFGAAGAFATRYSGGTTDAAGNTGNTYFAIGKYSINSLTKNGSLV
jgi:hypothetical protein